MVIDTNIALRYLLRDNDEAFARASEIFESGETIRIDDVVIFEMVYIMMGRNYNISQAKTVKLITIMLKINGVVNPSNLAIRYLKQYSENNLDLADCYLITLAIENGDELKTFDKKMQKVYEQELANY